MSKQQFLWVEHYRPDRLEDTILPESLRQSFTKFVKEKNIPNLLLVGTAGVGKTSTAKAMLNEIGCDYIVINGSMNGNIDTLRNDIQQFASSSSFIGGRKYVILDEADHITSTTQAALRNFMEEFSNNCGFILTANYGHKIIEPLRSRCAVIDFAIAKEEKGKIALGIYKRILSILDNENVSYDKGAIKELVRQYFPDFRRMLNELQFYSSQGHLGSNIIRSSQDAFNFEELVEFLKNKDFTSVRKWIGETEVNSDAFFSYFYNTLNKHFKPQSIPAIVLCLAKYQDYDTRVLDKQINLAACCVEIMVDGVFL